MDHVVPVALGGQTIPENLAAACQACNQGKAGSPPDASQVADVQADAVRWARAMRAAAAIQMQQRQARQQYVATIDATWLRWRWGDDDDQPIPRPDDWRDSVGRWFDLGLEVELLADLVAVAMRRVDVDQVWRYFCGACWKVLRDRTEMAREIAAGGDQVVGP